MEAIDKLVSDELDKRRNPDDIIIMVRDRISGWATERVAELTEYGDSNSQHDAIIRVAAILERNNFS